MTWFRHPPIAWLVSGLLLGIGFLNQLLWPLGVLGGILFFYQLKNSNGRWLFIGPLVAWFLKAASANLYFWSVYPIEWLPLQFGSLQWLGIIFYWLTVSLYLASGGLVFILVYLFGRWLLGSYGLITAPLGWVLGEVFSSWVFSVFMIGPGGGMNISYSFGYVGYLLASQPVFLLAMGWGGVYALSAGFVLLVTLLEFMGRRFGWWRVLVVFSVILVPANVVYQPTIPTGTDGYTVAIIETQIPAKATLDNEGESRQNILKEAMSAALASQPDYVVLPEDARFFDQSQPVGVSKQQFYKQYQKQKAVIVDSGRVEVSDRAVLQALIFDGERATFEEVQKRYLVPQGEYVPALYRQLFGLVGYHEAMTFLDNRLSYRVGPQTNQAHLADNLPAVLFCFESVDPRGVRTILEEHQSAPFVAHVISHAWFHDPESLWGQLDAMLRVQAYWNQVVIVSAGNQVVSKVYYPNGSIEIPKEVAVGDGWVVREVVLGRD